MLASEPVWYMWTRLALFARGSGRLYDCECHTEYFPFSVARDHCSAKPLISGTCTASQSTATMTASNSSVHHSARICWECGIRSILRRWSVHMLPSLWAYSTRVLYDVMEFEASSLELIPWWDANERTCRWISWATIDQHRQLGSWCKLYAPDSIQGVSLG